MALFNLEYQDSLRWDNPLQLSNSLEQIGKIVKSRDAIIKGLNIEIRGLKNELYKKGENFALKTQELKDWRDKREFLDSYKNIQRTNLKKR